MNETEDQAIAKAYYLPGTSKALERVYERAQKIRPVTRAAVKAFIARQESTQTFSRKSRTRKWLNPTGSTEGPFQKLECDLLFMPESWQYKNGNHRYVFVLVDTFNGMTWLEALKDKEASTTANAMSKVIAKMAPLRAVSVKSDAGTEFLAEFLALLNANNIKKIISPVAFTAERKVKDVRARLYRFLQDYRTIRWVDHVQDVANSINEDRNRLVGMSPNDSLVHTEKAVLYKKLVYLPSVVCRSSDVYKVGDLVRKMLCNDMACKIDNRLTLKDATPKASLEVYTVKAVHRVDTFNPRYSLENDNDPKPNRTYNANDLVHATPERIASQNPYLTPEARTENFAWNKPFPIRRA